MDFLSSLPTDRMAIHRLIRQGRLRLGMTEQQFADAAGVSRGAVQQWERAGGTAAKRGNQPVVAALLGISVAELVSGGTNVGSGIDVRGKVPLVSESEAGNYGAIDNFQPHAGVETVPVSVPVQRHTYALRVHGDSMVSETADSFPDGSIIVVEPELQPLPGDYVIALDSENETTFKQLVKDGGELFLKPLNPRYPIRPLGSATVIGVVREFTKRFR
jgi:SOS-response transcriptional repressor LexA